MHSNKDLVQYYELVSKLVRDNIMQLLPDNAPNIIYEAMRYMVLDCGKMYRSFLLFAAAKIFTNRLEPFIHIATVIELIHTYTLIHDDLPCMDNDDFRRGKLACHKKYNEAIAILSGNALLTLAYETLASQREELDNAIKLELITQISKLIGGQGTIYGQCLDIVKSADSKQRQQINLLKTANLFIASVDSVAIICKISNTEKKALREFATNFGLAYQMMDDIDDQDNYCDQKLLTSLQNESLKCLNIFGNKALLLQKFTSSLFNK